MIILCFYIHAIIVEMFPTNLTRVAIGLGTLETLFWWVVAEGGGFIRKHVIITRKPSKIVQCQDDSQYAMEEEPFFAWASISDSPTDFGF